MSINSIAAKVNFKNFGPTSGANETYVKSTSVKNNIEKVLNIMVQMLYSKCKNMNSVSSSDMITEIKSKYPDYEKVCLDDRFIKADGSCDGQAFPLKEAIDAGKRALAALGANAGVPHMSTIETLINAQFTGVPKDMKPIDAAFVVKRTALEGAIDALVPPLSPADRAIVKAAINVELNKAPISPPKTMVIFTKDRLDTILTSLKNNDELKKACKFKKTVLYASFRDNRYNGSLVNSLTANSVANWGRLLAYPVAVHLNQPYYGPYVSSMRFNGGMDNEVDKYDNINYGLGRYVDEYNYVKPIKYIDFTDFENGYDDYHMMNNVGKINVKMCKLIDDKFVCSQKELNIPVQKKNEDSSEEFNVKTKGYHDEFEKAYKILKLLENSKDPDEAFNYIKLLLKYIIYYTLPLKTIDKSKKVYDDIKNN